ncbi:hypothetical protein [Megasphaera massiliensis]|uniref:hypothetical protein n=1 Tax=Megasphaera massiliensis TaxID=1232428 RepID=UPI003AB68049
MNDSARKKILEEVVKITVYKLSESGVSLEPEEVDYFLKLIELEVTFKWHPRRRRLLEFWVMKKIDRAEAERIFFGDKDDEQ